MLVSLINVHVQLYNLIVQKCEHIIIDGKISVIRCNYSCSEIMLLSLFVRRLISYDFDILE